MRVAAALVLAFVVAGCSPLPAPPTTAWGSRVPEAAPDAVASQPVVARGADSITLLPISPSGATVGIAYGYDMPHCGINSPIDVDGTFWDAVGIAPDSVDFDGQPGTFRLASHDAAEFTRSDGRVLTLVRHEGPKEFRFCF